jgi:hypothetical protein
LTIENRLAPRHIAPSQRAEIVRVLKPHSISTVLLTRLGEKEANDYGTEIIDTLVDGGWQSRSSTSGKTCRRCMAYKSDSSASGKASAAALPLLAGNVNLQLKGDPRVPDAVAVIYVGLKPPG